MNPPSFWRPFLLAWVCPRPVAGAWGNWPSMKAEPFPPTVVRLLPISHLLKANVARPVSRSTIRPHLMVAQSEP